MRIGFLTMGKLSGRAFSTDLEIKKLKAEEKTYWVKDLLSTGLFIEVSPKGGKTWQFRYTVNGKQERVKLGKYPQLSLNQARINRAVYEETYVFKGLSKDQVKLEAEKLKERNILFSEMAQKFAERKIIGQIKNQKAMQAYISNDILPIIGDLSLQEIKYSHIDKIINRKLDQGFPSAAHQIRQLLKRIFEMAIDLEYIEKSPVKKTILEVQLQSKPKQRALSVEEMTEFYTTLLRSNSARATKLGLLLSLLVLIRKSELTQAKWEHINFETGIWHIPRPKGWENAKYSSEPFNVYMSEQVKTILRELKKLAGDSEYILPGRTPDKPISRTVFNMAINAVLRKMPEFGHFTVHDIRRTAASILNNLGYNSDIIEKCLNHKMLGIRGIYNHAEYELQRKEMMQKWGDHVFSLIPIVTFYVET